jgi:hypothetical protein
MSFASIETPDSSSSLRKLNSTRIENYVDFNWSISSEYYDEPYVKYLEVINFLRFPKSHHCVMCGLHGNIPAQNKDVCKGCDVAFWYQSKYNVVIKFCKGI